MTDPTRFSDAESLELLPVAYVEVGPTGILLRANQAACRMHRMSAEDLIGRSIWEFVPTDEAASDRAEFLHAIETGEDLPVIRRALFSAGAGFRTHEIHRRILRDPDGRPAGLACVTFDVSELEDAQQESKRAERWLESALSAIPQAVILIDALGFVRAINPSAERLTGWQAHELIGLQVEQGIPILRAVSRSQKPLSFRTTLHEVWNGDVEILLRNQQTASVWLSASPLLDTEAGCTTGVVIVLGSPRTVVAVEQPISAAFSKSD